MAQTIDLMPFCAAMYTNPDRTWLHGPIHFDSWTVATNGHIAVRIPRLPDTEVTPSVPPSVLSIFDLHAADDWGELPLFTSPAGTTDCDWCLGSGTEVEGEDALPSVCPACLGTTRMPLAELTSVELKGTIFSGRYLQRIRALPFPKLSYGNWPSPYAGQGVGNASIKFVFEGGIGLLMPMRRPHASHFQLTRPGAVV